MAHTKPWRSRLAEWRPRMAFSEGAFLAIGVVLGSSLTVYIMADWSGFPTTWRAGIRECSESANCWEAAGTWATFVVALVGLLGWRWQRRKEFQAKVAGDAYLAALDLCRMLDRVTSGERPQSSGGSQLALYLHWEKIFEEGAQVLSDFQTARLQVETHFDEKDQVSEHFRNLDVTTTRLRGALADAIARNDGDGISPDEEEEYESDARKRYETARGKTLAMVKLIRHDLHERLRPFARLKS